MAVPMPGLSEKRIWPHATAHTCSGFGLGLGPGLRVGSGLRVGVWAHLALDEARVVELADVIRDALGRAVEREGLHEQHAKEKHGTHLQAQGEAQAQAQAQG